MDRQAQYIGISCFAEVVSEELSDLLDEFYCLTVLLSWHVHSVVYTNSEIFGHESFLDTFDNTAFKSVAEVLELLVFIEFSSMKESSCPSEDAGD